MKEPRKVLYFDDLDLLESIYPHCMQCGDTGDVLDLDLLKEKYGKEMPLKVIKKLLVCQNCGKNDEIILRVISNEAMPNLGVEVV